MDKRMVFLGMIVVLFAVGIRAEQLSGDFSVESECTVPATETYILTNDSAVETTYTISAVGANADWIIINGIKIATTPLIITLGAGESTELVAFISPTECYVEPGTYYVTVNIDRDWEIEVIVINTRSLSLDVSPSDAELGQCEAQEFDAVVKNTGKHNDYVELSVVGIPANWVSLADPEFLLEKGNSRQFSFTVTPDCDAAIKTYNFDLVAAIRNTSYSTRESLSLEIEDLQEINISSGALKACSDSATSATIEIENNGTLADGLKLSLTGLDWASLEENSVALEAGQTAEVTVDFEESNAPVGNYGFSVTAHSKEFGKDTVQQFNVTVRDCYNISIASVDVDFDGSTACLESSPKYTFSLENDSEKDVTLETGVKGVSATVIPAMVSLNSGQTAQVEVTLDLEGEEAGTKEFSLVLEGENFSLEEPYSITLEDCFAIEADFSGIANAMDLNADCEAEIVTLTFKNVGTKENTVQAQITGIDWIHIQPEDLILQPGQEKSVFVYVSPPYDIKEGQHTANLGSSAEDFSKDGKVVVNVFGGLYADLGIASLDAKTELQNLLEEVDRTVEVKLSITNDSNALLRVEDINVLGFYAEHTFSEKLLQPGETVEATVKLYLGKGWEIEEFPVKIQFITNKGILEREVMVDLNPENNQAATVGLFTMANARDALFVAIVAIVVALVVMAGLRMSKPKPSPTMSSIAKDVHAQPGKKLEEIGKKKAKGTKKKK